MFVLKHKTISLSYVMKVSELFSLENSHFSSLDLDYVEILSKVASEVVNLCVCFAIIVLKSISINLFGYKVLDAVHPSLSRKKIQYIIGFKIF